MGHYPRALPWADLGRALGAVALAPKGQAKLVKPAAQPLKPPLGCQSYNLPTLTAGEYIDLVDYTGRQVHSGKRGMIEESEPKALDKLGIITEHSANRVQKIGFELAFWRHRPRKGFRGQGCLVAMALA